MDSRIRGSSGYERLESVSLDCRRTLSQRRDAGRQDRKGFEEKLDEFKLQEEKIAQRDGQFVRERQIAHMIYEHFRITGTNESLRDKTQTFGTTYDDICTVQSRYSTEE